MSSKQTQARQNIKWLTIQLYQRIPISAGVFYEQDSIPVSITNITLVVTHKNVSVTRGWKQTSEYWGRTLWKEILTRIVVIIDNLDGNLVMRPMITRVSIPRCLRISCSFVAWNPSNPFFIRTGSPSKALAQSRGIGSPRVDAGFSWFSSGWSWSHQDIHGDS